MKTNKFVSLITTCMLSLCAVPLSTSADFSYATPEGYILKYSVSENSVSIIECSGTAESLTIPDSIEGLPVTNIKPSAFMTCTNLNNIKVSDENKYFYSENGILMNYEQSSLIKYWGNETSVTIPYGIKRIESSAFFGINSEYIEIPDTVSYIGDNAFAGCTSLKNITIPDSVTYLGEKSFMSCSHLEKIVLSKNLTKLNDETFCVCPELKTIIIPENISEIGNDVFFSHNPNLSVYGFQDSSAENYAIENNINFYMIGDVDNDGFLNASDSSRVLGEYSRMSSGQSTSFNEIQRITADYNIDGSINAADASAILAEYAANS